MKQSSLFTAFLVKWNKSLHGLSFLLSHPIFLFLANMQHHCETEEASSDSVINNNGVIELRAIFPSGFGGFFLQCNNYSAIMTLIHCLHPVLISKPHCDTQATFDNEIRGRGWGEASNWVRVRVRLERSVSLQGGDTGAVGYHSEVLR